MIDSQNTFWWVYILECSDGTYYIGTSNNVEKRIQTHNSGKGAKYTKVRLPVKFLYKEKVENRSEAQKREFVLKQLTRSQKTQLISSSSI